MGIGKVLLTFVTLAISDETVSVDEAVERGSDYVGGQGQIIETPGGNYQFTNEYYYAAGNRINDTTRFDVDPDASHIQYSPLRDMGRKEDREAGSAH